MKVAFVSDLHIDTSLYNLEAVRRVVDYLSIQDPHVVCLLGDISPHDFTEILLPFKELRTPNKFLVPGNHDVWLTGHEMKSCLYGSRKDSLWKAMHKIHRICWDTDWKLLLDGPQVIDRIAFVGTLGWYDYSFKDNALKIPMEQYVAKHTLLETWMDGERTFFWSPENAKRKAVDKEIADYFNDLLDDHLKSVDADKTVCVSHFVPFKELQEGMHEGPSFFNAYGGNKAFGKLLVKHKVDISVSGHLHRNLHRNIEGIECYQTAIGYLGEEHTSMSERDWDRVLMDRVLLLDL